MFQPGEEGHHGARFMLDEGLLDVAPLADGTPSPVTGAFALHITSTLPTGWVSSRGGPIMASADRFIIDVIGFLGSGDVSSKKAWNKPSTKSPSLEHHGLSAAMYGPRLRHWHARTLLKGMPSGAYDYWLTRPWNWSMSTASRT
jgi:hypothetical protein